MLQTGENHVRKTGREDLRAGEHLGVNVQLSQTPRDEMGILTTGDSCQLHGSLYG